MSSLRNLVLLLVLVNLGVLALFQWFVARPEPRPPYRGPGITLLREVDREMVNAVLLSLREEASAPRNPAPGRNGGESPEVDITELERIDLSAAAGEPDGVVADGAVTSVTRCTSIGPYLETAEADAAIATLIASGFEPTRRSTASQVWQGYRVYVDRAGAEAVGGEVVAALRENGFDATPVVASTGERSLISLGVFSDIASAGAAVERVGELGYEATIADSMTTAETYWLDVSLAANESIDVELLQAPGEISRLEQLPCLGTGAE